MLFSLVSRHNKNFFRDRLVVFFSLLTVIIVIALYIIFLQKMQVDAISQSMPVTTELKLLVNEWMVAGLLAIMPVTTTLALFGIYVKDVETKVAADFLATTLHRTTILISYLISSLIIGFVLTVFGYVACTIFLLSAGGELLDFITLVKVLAVILLGVLLSAMFNLLIVTFVKTQNAFSTISTLIGTVIGFLCGVYVPLGVLPSAVQSFIHFFPISHTAVLLRQILMEDSLETVFAGNEEAMQIYMEEFGVVYKVGETVVTQSMSVLFMIASIMVIALIAALNYKRKNK